MGMMLVRKKAPRGARVRTLSEEEVTAVQTFFGKKKAVCSEMRALATDVIHEMRQRDLWLQCSCVPDDSPALNSAKLMDESQTLFLAGFNHPHSVNCPMFREFKGDEGATSSGTRKNAGSRRLSYRDFLPPDESETIVRASRGTHTAGSDRTRRKRIPRLARLLLTLLEDAKLNQLRQLWPIPTSRPRDSLDDLIVVADSQEFIRGRTLSELVLFRPWMSNSELETHMAALERPDANWPAGKARIFYQIFMADIVSREGVTFKLKELEINFAPERGVSINGESGDGIRPPYWVILSFRRGSDGQVICSDGYAHALYSRSCPVPVDSGLERKTLEGLFEVAKWLYKKPGTPALSLEKPLFDIQVEVNGVKGFVLPDFIITACTSTGESHTVVIETMGYTDDDYCERKAEQHKGMRQLGLLVTDPPRWPNDNVTPFERYMFGRIVNLKL